jgi:hypothetical protein
MQKSQRWRELCAQAAVEQDPKKLMNWSLKLADCSRKNTTKLA